MSERIGPMAWGSQGMVFLGEDLMHTRDYSDETSRVIDEEVERILRQEEERAMTFLQQHRGGLDLVSAALLEKETIDGAEVARLVDQAFGRPVHVNDGKAPTPESLAPIASLQAPDANYPPPRLPDAAPAGSPAGTPAGSPAGSPAGTTSRSLTDYPPPRLPRSPDDTVELSS